MVIQGNIMKISNKKGGRRQFLKGSVALGLTAGALPVARANYTSTGTVSEYGERSRFVTAKRISDEGRNCSFGSACNTLSPLQHQDGIITPSDLHFFGAHGAYPPDINPDEHELMIHGMVERPLNFSMAALRRLPIVSHIHMIECTANRPKSGQVTVQHTHGKTSCSEWTGVPMSALLNEAGVKSGAKWVVCEAVDRQFHSKSVPLDLAMDICYVAYAQNGEPLRPHQGFPIRLMVPGFGGWSHVKWLRRIKVVDKPYLSPTERFQGRLGPKSVITTPSGGQQLTEHGYHTIFGLAWSGAGAIRSVEVSTDGGRNWQVANLHGPVLPIAHTRFSLGWKWNGEETTIMSRCTDEKGQVQQSAEALAREAGVTVAAVINDDGYESHHGDQSAYIFPWKVARDGQVKQAIWL